LFGVYFFSLKDIYLLQFFLLIAIFDSSFGVMQGELSPT